MPKFELTSPDGKRYEVEGPEGATPEQAYGILQQQLSGGGGNSYLDTAKQEALGAAKGVGQGLGGVMLQIPGLGTPSVGELDPAAKKWTQEPSANVGQSVGKVVGGALPFMIGGPEAIAGRGIAEATAPLLGRLAGPIGEVAGNPLVGAASGAAQPPEKGQSRLTNAATGAVGGAITSPRVAGAVSRFAGGAGAGYGLEQLIRQFGWEPVVGAMAGGLGYGWHSGLYSATRKASNLASYPGKIIANYTPAGLGGAGMSALGGLAQSLMDQQKNQ